MEVFAGPELKEPMRQQLANDVQNFLTAGGDIVQIPTLKPAHRKKSYESLSPKAIGQIKFRLQTSMLPLSKIKQPLAQKYNTTQKAIADIFHDMNRGKV